MCWYQPRNEIPSLRAPLLLQIKWVIVIVESLLKRERRRERYSNLFIKGDEEVVRKKCPEKGTTNTIQLTEIRKEQNSFITAEKLIIKKNHNVRNI